MNANNGNNLTFENTGLTFESPRRPAAQPQGGGSPALGARRIADWERHVRDSAEQSDVTNGASTEASTVRRIPLRTLVPGSRLDQDLFDDQGRVLISANTTISAELIERLRARGFVSVRAGRRKDHAKPKTKAARRVKVDVLEPRPRRAAAAAESTTADDTSDQGTGGFDLLDEARTYAASVGKGRPAPPPSRLDLASLREETQVGMRCYKSAVERYAGMSRDMAMGKTLNVQAADELLHAFQTMLQKDRSIGPLVLDLKSDPDDYLYHHGLNVALLSMSIAAPLGLCREEVLNMGVGALFSDLGMLRVPRSIRFAPRKLTPGERMEINQHPIHTVNILERSGALNQSSLLAAYQAHERCDGTGYPRSRNQMFIHPLARVVAIADSYAAMTCNRPHRSHRISPYQAMVTILRDQSRLDRTVARAFLECMSLFPIGSQVLLSDGRNARVLRSNGAAHTRPVVVPLDDDGNETVEELDLTRDLSVEIAAALDQDGQLVESA